VAAIFFSSFFSNAAGLADTLRTYQPWIKRAGGETPHIHPWYFYLQHLLFFHSGRGPVWTEAVIFLLALVGALAGFRRRLLGRANSSFIRFIALYTFLLTAFYSLLAYKTPWCLLSFWLGMMLLAGTGAAVLVRCVRRPFWKPGLTVLLLASAAHLAWQSWQQNTLYAADQRNPYVYAQTSPDLLKLVARVQSLSAVHSQHSQMLIKVMAPEDDYWPLPWYLRDFKQIGWWDKVPKDPFASIMIVSAKFDAKLDKNKSHLMVGYFALRPQVFLELYVEKQLWRDWLAAHLPQPDE
jgi:predicted membrane-bound mannosyltransferase